MTPLVTAYRLPKKGNAIEECEDAFDFSSDNLRFAMADGATESSFADRWATSLVKQYAADPPFGSPPSEDALQIWMLPLQMEWKAGINWSGLPWFALEKAERGAYAALLGLEFSGPGSIWQKLGKALAGESMGWQAFAIGDTCLFQVRDDRMLCAFPIEKSDLFNSRPILLASNEANNLSALKDIRSAAGGCKAGDLFILATDALAKWFLSRCEAGDKPWVTLQNLKSEAEFAAFTDKARAEQGMRNDDTTLLLIQWTAD